jgi:hypothetical protein
MSQKATKEQVRAWFKAQGYEVCIDRDDSIVFRKPGESWREGRWVSEYRIIDGEVVHP